MTWLVVTEEGAEAAPIEPQQLRAALDGGHVPATASVSQDGGRSWLPAWQAAQQQRQADDALAMVVPVHVNSWALIAGYVGLLSVLFFGGPVCLIAGAFFAAPKATWAIRLGALVAALVMGPLPPAALAYLGHRQLRRTPGERGMGRVVTGYVTAALMVVVFAVTAILTTIYN